MIKVIPFEPEHIMGMEPLMDDACTKAMMQSIEYLQALKRLGPAYSGFTDDGKCVGAAGVKQINAKTYEGWALLAVDSKQHIKSILRAVELFVQNFFDYDVADRFQATVKMNFPQGHRFAKLLSFKPEGILHNYDQNEDYMMYARTNTCL